MKPTLLILGVIISLHGYCQQYKVGLVKTGSVVKNTEGQIVVTDSTVTSTIDGTTTSLKIAKRNGYTLHVTDGTTESKYVISHVKGKLHGFSYDRSITYHPAKHISGAPLSVFMCEIKHDQIAGKP